jgi:simple sugar transport system substrate-binding protein
MPIDADINSSTPVTSPSVSTADLSSSKKGKSKLLFILLFLIIIGIGTYLTYSLMVKPAVKNIAGPAKFCQGVKIAMFVGGNQVNIDPFTTVLYSGAKAAEITLGANVQYFWSDWNASKMVEQFQDAMSTSPDAIAMLGHPGADALSSLIDEAERKGIIVTMQNVDIPAIREKYTNNGFGYAGPDLYQAGLTLSNGLIRKYQPKEGSEVIVFATDKNTDPARYARTQGMIDGLTAAKLVVDQVTLYIDMQKGLKTIEVQKMFGDAMTKYPNAKFIMIDGAIASVVPFHFKALGKKPGEYIVAGYDLSSDVVAGIKSGYIGIVEDQQPYLQGFLPILQACLTKKYGFAGLYVNTGIGLIDSSNVDLITDFVKQGIR